MGKNCKSIILVVVIVSLLFTACSPPLQETSRLTGTESSASSSDVTESSDYQVSADNFRLEESTNGVGSILIGELTPGVTVNARIYCEKDLTDPGIGSVDTAVNRVFLPSDVDLLVSPEWTKIADETLEWKYEGIDNFQQRIAEYTDENNNQIRILNSYANFDYEVQYGSSSLLSCLHNYERIPWFSADLAWGTEEFEFGTEEEAYAELNEYAARLGVTVSPIYQIEYVTPVVMDTLYRLQVADGSEGLPEKARKDEDSAYWIEAAQEWNGLLISNDHLGKIFDGINLTGTDYHNTSYVNISFLQTASGVRNFRMINVFQLLEKGTDEELISLWDALQALKVHIENPKYEMEILYNLPEKDVLIDQIELCYLPINQATVNSDNPNAGFTEGLLETENGGKTFLFQMTPCWTFRVIWTKAGSSYNEYCAVNAISGEYILSTSYFPGI
jgi:hypothetical protein